MDEGIISTKSICKLMLLNKDIANPFQVNVPFLYPLKTSENQRFSEVFTMYSNGTMA